MAPIALEFLIVIASIVVILLALSGAIICIQYVWNVVKSVFNHKE